jgi:hypothetical protein
MTEIATQVVTAAATSISTLTATALTLLATGRSEPRRARMPRCIATTRNVRKRVSFLATHDAFFACCNYQAGQIDVFDN